MPQPRHHVAGDLQLPREPAHAHAPLSLVISQNSFPTVSLMNSPNDSPAYAAMHELLAARRRALARLRLLMLLAIVVPTVAFLGVAAYLHKRDFADATTKLDRSARVAHEHALKLFDTNEMLLQRMLDLLGERGSSDLLDDAQLTHLRLARMADRLPQVQGLFVMGADARMLASSRVVPPRRDIDYTDRDWYQAHSKGDAGVFFTRQIVSRATGERAFDMSRRREVRGRLAAPAAATSASDNRSRDS